MRDAGEIVIINGGAAIYARSRPKKKVDIIDNGLVTEVREEDIEMLQPENDLDAARGVILGVSVCLVFWLGILVLVLSSL